MEGSDVDHVMRDANEEAANDEATAAAVDDPEAKEDEEEEDSDEEPWGKKKPIKPRLIQDVLIPFPKPDQMVKAEDRDHTILANMKWIHNAQRAQMRERHVAEIKQVQQDLQKSIDWDIITNLYPPTQEGFKQFVNPIVRQSLNSPGRFLKPTPLDVLPAAHRTVLVQKDQFERLRREKQQDPSSMDVDPEPKSELSVAELEFYLEDMMAHEIAKRKEEELDLYMLQEEEKHPIYRSIQKKMNSGRPALSRSVTSKDEPPRKLARRTSLPPLRTTENLVNKMQGVTLTALSAKTPVSTTSAIAEEGPHSAGATGSRRHSMQERRSSAASIAESALLRVNDRRSPGRDMDVEAPQPPASPPKDLEQPEVHQTHKRKASIDAVQTDETAPVAKDRRLSREIRPENVPPWRRNSTAERPDTTSPRWSAAQSTNYNPWSAETSEWAQARRRSEENPISPRDRSRSPGRRASDDTRSRNYWDPEARSWNVWVNPNKPNLASPRSRFAKARNAGARHSTASRPNDAEYNSTDSSFPRRNSDSLESVPWGESNYNNGNREQPSQGTNREYSWPSGTGGSNWQNRGYDSNRGSFRSTSWRPRRPDQAFRGWGGGRGRGEIGDGGPNFTPSTDPSQHHQPRGFRGARRGRPDGRERRMSWQPGSN